MIKVTLIGDSIRGIGYGKVVPKLLGEGFEVFQPNENCRFAKYTLRGLFDWEKDMRGSRIVHWNNGLWDVCDILGDGKLFTSDEEYVSNMLRVADILLKRYDKVIFATTTPVSLKNIYNKNENIKRFNDLIVPRLQEKGVIINDLYSTVITDLDRFICSDTIHLSEDGIEVCSKQVADIILKTAKELGDGSETKAVTVHTDGAPV
ncbi:MAG: SGNH/GDSL hydrolase family protein [Clostridia bacterium]|nr:SGNH/GDSL hydrolase family protein [Clostridia bacterium]